VQQHNSRFDFIAMLTTRSAATRPCFPARPKEFLVIKINWMSHNTTRHKRI
jgi:hypothetical protein